MWIVLASGSVQGVPIGRVCTVVSGPFCQAGDSSSVWSSAKTVVKTRLPKSVFELQKRGDDGGWTISNHRPRPVLGVHDVL